MRPRLFAPLVFLLLAAPLAADDQTPPASTRALINAAMDRQVKISINDEALPKALEQISKQTGVPLSVAPDTWDLLPYGSETKLKQVKIENQTLREALEGITRKLGLTFEIKDETVELQPLAALCRLGRSATVEELIALDKLASTPLDQPKGAPLPTAPQLIDAIDHRLEVVAPALAIEDRARAILRDDQQITVARNATLMDALDAITRETAATWYPSGKTIVLLDKRDQIRRQLEKTINLRYSGVELSQVLADLAKSCGVHFDIEPGAIQQVPPEARNIHLILENLPIHEALESIGGFTGLGYMVRPNSIYIWNQSNSTAVHVPNIGILQLDDGLQIFLPETQVPPDVREYLKYKTQQEIGRIRKMMQAEGFKPSTPSAEATTQP